MSVSDETLIKWVKEAFPPFLDDDPKIGKDQLIIEAIKGSSDAIEELGKMVGKIHGELTDAIYPF